MGKLPVCSGMEIRKVFEKLGWVFDRQTGSHMILVKEGVPVTLSVPNHKEVARGTLRSLLATAEVSVERFKKLL